MNKTIEKMLEKIQLFSQVSPSSEKTADYFAATSRLLEISESLVGMQEMGLHDSNVLKQYEREVNGIFEKFAV